MPRWRREVGAEPLVSLIVSLLQKTLPVRA
jgi:hypothetical protein